jgi:hypothetical protein
MCWGLLSERGSERRVSRKYAFATHCQQKNCISEPYSDPALFLPNQHKLRFRIKSIRRPLIELRRFRIRDPGSVLLENF